MCSMVVPCLECGIAGLREQTEVLIIVTLNIRVNLSQGISEPDARDSGDYY